MEQLPIQPAYPWISFTQSSLLTEWLGPSWPPTSPDLSVCDYFLWGTLKSKVYRNNPHGLQELQQNISDEIAAVQLRSAFSNLLTRAQKCQEMNMVLIFNICYRQIDVVHVKSTAKNAIDEKVKACMRRFVNIHGDSSIVVLLGGDINYAPELYEFRYLHGAYTILIYQIQGHESLMSGAHENFPLSSLTSNLPSLRAVMPDPPVQLTVSELPKLKQKKLRAEIKKLSNNTGGKLKNIRGKKAILQFSNSILAHKAIERINNQKIKGNVIKIGFASENEDESESDNQSTDSDEENLGLILDARMRRHNAAMTPTVVESNLNSTQADIDIWTQPSSSNVLIGDLDKAKTSSSDVASQDLDNSQASSSSMPNGGLGTTHEIQEPQKRKKDPKGSLKKQPRRK